LVSRVRPGPEEGSITAHGEDERELGEDECRKGHRLPEGVARRISDRERTECRRASRASRDEEMAVDRVEEALPSRPGPSVHHGSCRRIESERDRGRAVRQEVDEEHLEDRERRSAPVMTLASSEATMPVARAIARAVPGWSLVIITVRTPARTASSTLRRELARG
jgi:hypothetical protein